MESHNTHIGSDFEDFLNEEGIGREIDATAIKRVIAFQLKQEMTKKHLP